MGVSAFEFILILISVVAAFAVSEVLSGWGFIIRTRVSPVAMGVHLIASFWLLAMIVRYVWVLWGFREINWEFIGFVVALTPILVLALAAYVTNPERTAKFNPRTHYIDHARPFCYLVALYLVLWAIGDAQLLASIVEAEPFVPRLIAMKLIIAAVCVALAHVRKPMLHGAFFAAILTVVIYMSTVAVTQL